MSAHPPSGPAGPVFPGDSRPPPPLSRLQEAHDRLQATLEALPDLLFVLDRDGRIHDYHAPVQDRLYVPPDQFLGRLMKDVLPEPAAGIINWAIEDAVVHGYHRGSVYPLPTPSGDHWFEVSIAAQGDPQKPQGRLVAIVRDITARRTAEEKLRNSEAQFRMLTESMKDVAWVFDVEDRCFTYVSPSVEALRGFTPEEILARPFEEALVPEQRGSIGALLEQSAARFLGGEADENTFFTLQILQPCKDGSTVPSEAVCRFVRNRRNGRLELQGITRDMSARVRAEEAIRQSERRLRQIIDLVPHFIFAKDAEGRFILANQAIADAYGTTVEAILGKTDAHFDVSEEEVRHFREDDLAVLASGQPLVVPEETITDFQGRQRTLATTKIPFTAPDPPVPAVLGVAVDITDLRRTEAALREREQRFKEIAEQSRMMVWEVDTSGMYTYVNEVCFDLLGYPPGEIVGKLHFYDLHPEDGREAFKAATLDVVRRRAHFRNLENPVQAKDGAVLWVSTTAEPLLDADGSLRGYRGSDLDITDRKRAEDSLRIFKESVENSSDAVGMSTPEGKHYYQNRAFDELFGPVGENPPETLFADPAVGHEVFRTIMAGGQWTGEVQMHAKDRRILDIFLRAYANKDESGRITALLGIHTDITERKRAEDALRDSRDQMARAQEMAHLGSWELDLAKDELAWSDEVYRIFGLAPQEFAGTYDAFLDHVHPEDRAAVDAAYWTSVRDGSAAYELDHRIVREGTREIRWVHEKCTHVRDARGKVVRSIGMVLDITERKQAEDALQESELRLRALNDNLPDGLVYQIDYGPDGKERRFLFMSQGTERLHGVTVNAALADASIIYGQILEEDRPLLAALEARAAETLTPLRADVRFRLPSGEVRWRHFTSAPRRLANGHLVWDGIELDITDRKHAEEALRENEERFEQSAKQSRTYLWEVDPTGLFTFVNPVVEDVLGYRPEELVGRRHFYDLMPEGRRESFQAEILEAIQQRLSFHDYENPCQSKDGRVVWVITAAIPMLNADGTLKGYRGSDTDITARKQAEEDLRLSEQTYRMLTETMKDVVWVLDVEAQRFLYVSPSVTALRGFTPEEILARPLVESWAPEEREALMQRMQFHVGEFLAGRIGEDFYLTLEMRQPCKDGSTTSSEVVCHLVRNRKTGRLELHGVSRDVTERKQAEKALRQSEAKYRLLHETMRDAFVSVDMKGYVLEANAAFQTLTGYDEAELHRLTYKDLTPEKWHAHEAKIVAEQIMTRGYSDVYQKEYIHKDGTVIPIEIRTNLIRDEAGHPVGMWATLRNITARLRVERALRQATDELERRVQERTADLEASKIALARSEEQFRQMTEIIQEVFWLIDAKSGAALYVSPAFEDIWKRPTGEFMSGVPSWLATLHPDDRDRVHQDFMRGIETGEFTPLEYRILRPDGSIRWIQDSAWAIRDPQGVICRVAGVFHDVTDRRRLEADILNAAELERQRIGRDLHDSLGQALTGIGYLAEALREELARESRPEAEEAGKLAHLVVDAADRAHAMARGLLLADMRRGGLAPALHELAFRTHELFGVECRYQGLAEVDLRDMEVAGHLYRIAQEAATNAAKHGKGKGVCIRLEQKPEGLWLSVRDAGPGMPKQPDGETRMGLDIMRYRAGLIGGTFWIDSRPGQGTTVNCVIPRSSLHPEKTP